MELTKLQKILSKKHRGAYTTIVYIKDNGNGYVKTTKTTIRLIDYRATHEPSANANGASRANNDIHLGNNLIYNQKTKKTRLQVFLTHCRLHAPQSTYTFNGKPITKEEYEEANPKKSKPLASDLFTINIENIVSIA